MCRDGGGRPRAARAAAWQVRLVHRTLEGTTARRDFPPAFAAAQTPSARGTAPYIVVARTAVAKAARARVAACGAHVVGVLPPGALLVEADAAALRRLAGAAAFVAAAEVLPEDKVAACVRAAVRAGAAALDVTALPLRAEDGAALAAFVRARGGATLPKAAGDALVHARVPAPVVEALARRGDVLGLEPYAPAALLNDVAVEPGLLNVRPVWDVHGLTGAGQVVSTVDAGLDTGDPATLMADFRGRVCGIRTVVLDTGETCIASDTNGHGTHTAGSLVGNGALSGGRIRGVAPGARLYVWQALDGKGLINAPAWSEVFRPGGACTPVHVASASWGYQYQNFYSSRCADIDRHVWRHPEDLCVFAAGNDGNRGASTILAPASAKNVLAVGATETRRPDLPSRYAPYADNPAAVWMGPQNGSAQGPTSDGRIKPDLCAPGTMILSTRTTQVAADADIGWMAYDAHYFYNTGTSMATPLVAGAAALVREWLTTRRGFTNTVPTAALVKAVLTGGARDLSAAAGADCGGAAPNNRQGWGRVDVGETLYPSNRAVACVDAIPFAPGSDYVVRLATTNEAPLDVQLAWLDAPAVPMAKTALVNDLDLVVSNETSGAVWWGNGVAGGDRANTVEGVRLAAAPPGVYAVHVKGVAVPYESGEGGAAALYARGAFAGPLDRDAGGRARTAPFALLVR